jgi:hypothetical protein
MVKKMAAAAAAGLIGGALILAGTAQATENEAPLSASHDLADCGKATITFTNNTAHTYDADIKIGDQAGTPDSEMPAPHDHGVTPDQTIAGGPHAGEPFGLRYEPVLLPPGESVTEVVNVNEDTTVSYRVWRGPENDYYLPWVEVEVTACPGDAAPISASHDLADCGKVTITFTNSTAHTYDADIKVGDQAGTPDSEMPAPHDHGVTPDQTIAGGPHAGEPFGLRYEPVLLPPGESVVTTIDVDEGTTVSYRVWRGPENDYYLPWVGVDVTACPADENGDKKDDETTPVADEKLPVTGTGLPILIGAGLMLLVGGGAAMALARRRGLV